MTVKEQMNEQEKYDEDLPVIIKFLTYNDIVITISESRAETVDKQIYPGTNSEVVYICNPQLHE